MIASKKELKEALKEFVEAFTEWDDSGHMIDAGRVLEARYYAKNLLEKS